MKTIYVTVAEFIENGGELKEFHELFSESGKRYGTFFGFTSSGVPMIRAAGTVMPEDPTYLFVEIECSPIYK